VPERAIGTDQSKKFLYVVANGKATFQEVTLGDSVDGQRVVVSGLKPGTQVIVDGIQHIAPGAPVKAQDVSSKQAAR
jgi:multidrug efflux system membrane fusion protein